MKNSELLASFFELEKNHQLFESVTSDGILWWDVVRYHIYIDLLDLTIRKPSMQATGKKKSRFRLLKLLFRDFKYLYNIRNRKTTTLFLTQPRGIDDKGFAIDPISQDCLAMIKSQSFIIDGLQTGCTKEPSYNNAVLLLFRKLFKLSSKKSVINFDFNTIINSQFKTDFNFEKKINILLNNYRADRLYYSKLLAFIKPELVLFSATGNEKGLMASAKSQFIETAELQHGQTNKNHTYYSYPEWVDYERCVALPDTFLSFSDHWHSVNYPVSKKLSIGNTLFNNMNKGSELKKDVSILVISHQLYVEDLIPLIKDLASEIPDVPFIFKLHPQQSVYEIEETKNRLSGITNIQVISTEKTTPELLSKASDVIAIQSSAVYEALQLGVKVFLYARKDFENHDDVFNNPNVFIVNNPEDIINKISSAFVSTDKNCFFMPLKNDVLRDFLENYNSIDNNL